MRGKSTPSQPARQPQSATSADVEQAIKALTHADYERIGQAARNRILRVRRSANGRSDDDLIQEAFTRILDGTRAWHKERVSFTDCLVGSIWSIASAWAGHHKRNKETPEYALLESVLSRANEEGKLLRLLIPCATRLLMSKRY